MSHCLCLTQAQRRIHLNHITFSPALHHQSRHGAKISPRGPTSTALSPEPEVCPSSLDERRESASSIPAALSRQPCAAPQGLGAIRSCPVFTAPSLPARNAQHIGARRRELPLALMEVWDINPTRGSEGINASVSGLELSGSAPQGL